MAPALKGQSNSPYQNNSPLLRLDSTWFDEVFRCYICLQNLTSPTLCPKCSKLCCEACIKKWLRERKEECPHCRAHIDQTHLVPCRFLDDIQEHIKKMSDLSSEQVDLCPEHNTRMTYYCHTCQTPICSDCGMFGDKHREHQFEKLEAIYEQRIDGLQSYLLALRKRMAKFTKKIKEVDRKVQNCNLAKVEADRELVGIVNRYRTNLELQLREKHTTLFSQRSTLVKQADFLLTTISKLDGILESRSQVEVLQSDKKVIDILHQVEQVILHNPGDDASVDMTFEKDFLPSYDLYQFRIPDFRSLLQEMGTFESTAVSQGGLVWHLRASLENVNEKNGGYLGLFIKLGQGDPSSSRYYIRAEMKHPSRLDSVIREFCFDLKAGDVRGFRQFCRVQTLVSKGFINSTGGYLELICGIRPLSYRQRCRDQRRYIQELEAQLSQTQLDSSNSSEILSSYSEVQPVLIQASISETHTATADTGVLSESATDDAYGEELIGPSDAMLIGSPNRNDMSGTYEESTDFPASSKNTSRLRSSSLSSHNPRPFNSIDFDNLTVNQIVNNVEEPLQSSSQVGPNFQPHYLRRLAKNALVRVEPRGFLIPPSPSRHSSRRTHQPTESYHVHSQLSRQAHKSKRDNGSDNSSDSEYDEDIDQCAAIPPFTNTEELRQLIHQELDSWSGNLSALNSSAKRQTRTPINRALNANSPVDSPQSSGMSSTISQIATPSDTNYEPVSSSQLLNCHFSLRNSPEISSNSSHEPSSNILPPPTSVSSMPPLNASPSIASPASRFRHRSHSSATCYSYKSSAYPPEPSSDRP